MYSYFLVIQQSPLPDNLDLIFTGRLCDILSLHGVVIFFSVILRIPATVSKSTGH